MKKFSVKPRSFHHNKLYVGASAEEPPEWNWIGKLGESGQKIDVMFDLSHPHVVSIFGKRGSGKSYTIGSFLEGLCTKEKETSVCKISKSQAVLLFDTLGIFQWINIALDDEAEKQKDVLKEQKRIQRGWDLKPDPLDVQIWIPQGTKSSTTPDTHKEFTVNSSDFTASDWGYLLGLDIYQDRMGQLLNDAFVKVVIEGWREGQRLHQTKEDYSINDLLQCVNNDLEIQDIYASETRRALTQQLTTYRRNPLFSEKGVPLNEFLKPGVISVVVMNKMPDELRLVLITALIRRLISERIEASENEKHLKIMPNLTDEEKKSIEEKLKKSIPPSWVAIDEAQNILPSERKTSATDTLIKYVREGRNYGLSFMVATQQPSAIDQRILSQVDTIISHKLTVQSDIDYVRKNLKSNLPQEVIYSNNKLSFDELLRSLDTGQAIVSNTETDRAFICNIRPRISVHGGF